ncbi:MAG TPA: hypothetical protein ENJ84_06650 [Gammaproteobacteria bacterium]|nr:hypothetical protein [Gammaproteobacteria bacterium]
MDQVPLGHVFETADRHPAKISTAFEQGKAALHQFESEAAKTLALLASGAATILVKLTAGNLVSMPFSGMFYRHNSSHLPWPDPLSFFT